MTLVEKLINEHNQAVQYAEESPEKDGFLSGMKKAIDIVKNHDGWISVAVRLPNPIDLNTDCRNHKNRLQVYFTNVYGVEMIDYAWFVYNSNADAVCFELCTTGDIIHPTHWQPLPKDPKKY